MPDRFVTIILPVPAGLHVLRYQSAADLKRPAVYVRGIAEMHTHEHVMMAESLKHTGASESAAAAFAMAGVGRLGWEPIGVITAIPDPDAVGQQLVTQPIGAFPVTSRAGLRALPDQIRELARQRRRRRCIETNPEDAVEIAHGRQLLGVRQLAIPDQRPHRRERFGHVEVAPCRCPERFSVSRRYRARRRSDTRRINCRLPISDMAPQRA